MARDPRDQFHLPLSQQAYEEYNSMLIDLQSVSLSDCNDTRQYIWGTGNYASQRFYKLCFWYLLPPMTFKWIWQSKVNLKINVFGWLLLMDRVNTRDLLDRKHCAPLNASLSCSICLINVRETRKHLFFDCAFSKACWTKLGWCWNSSLEFHQMLHNLRSSLPHQAFMDLFLLAAWNIWKERNSIIFQGIQPSISSWKSNLKSDLNLHLIRF